MCCCSVQIFLLIPTNQNNKIFFFFAICCRLPVAMLAAALFRDDKVIIDTRDTADIAARGNAIVGHINIPWTSFHLYQSRLQHLSFIIPAKDTPVVLYGDDEAAEAVELFEEALQQKCRYTNVLSCVKAADLVALNSALEISHHSNLLTTYADPSEIRALREQGAVLVDARDSDEIERYKDSFVGHINIPWSTFSHFSARLNRFGDELLGSSGKGKDSPVMVMCMRGRRAMFLKEGLEKRCGFTNVYNCENPARVHAALPEVEETGNSNGLSENLTVEEIKALGQKICMIDVREAEEIELSNNAIGGHVNIPFSSFSHYASRLTYFEEAIGSKSQPVLVYGVNGRRSVAFKDKLQRQCGFTQVYSCESSANITEAFPDIDLTGEPNVLSPYAALHELRQLFEGGSIIVDVREPEEIAAAGAFAGHINIPWSSFDEYLPRLSRFEEILGEKSRPIIVHCANGRRAALFKDALEKHCGYTKVFNGQCPELICSCAPELVACNNSANAVSTYASREEIKTVLEGMSSSTLIIDCREEDEIIQSGDALANHVSIPWSSFYAQASEYFKSMARNNSYFNESSPIVVYCSKGWRSGHMKRFLESCGYRNVINCQNSERIFAAVPALEMSKTNVPSPFGYP